MVEKRGAILPSAPFLRMQEIFWAIALTGWWCPPAPRSFLRLLFSAALRRLAAQLRTHTRDSQLEPATRQGGSPVVWRLPISQPYSLKPCDRLRTPPPP